MSKKWTASDVPDQSGRTVVVTGANSGLGLQTSKVLAGAGATVVLAVRDEQRGKAAAHEIDGTTEVRELDLADLSSVRAFADRWDRPIDVLINNAGVMAVPQARTSDGFEKQLGTNHLGHFALTNLLLPRVTDRVVTLSSGAHRLGRMDFDDLNWEHRTYRAWRAYGQSKLANLLFILELSRRLEGAGSGLKAYAAHPGYAATNLQSHTGNRFQHTLMGAFNKVIAQSDARGALPTLFAATQDLPAGSYVGPDGIGEQRGFPTLVSRSAAAADVDDAARLWQMSEELTGVGFPTPVS